MVLDFNIPLDGVCFRTSRFNRHRSVEPGRGRRENRAALGNALGDYLSQQNIPADAAHDDEIGMDYEKWNLAFDSSIYENTGRLL